MSYLPILYRKVLRACQFALSVISTPTPTEDPVDLLEWEVVMARYHSSPSTFLALTFAFVYTILYLPSEFNSLSKNIGIYYNVSASVASYASAAAHETDIANAQRSVAFFTWRVSSRITLVGLMAFLMGLMATSKICIPTEIYHTHLLHSLFKGLRELLRNKQPDPDIPLTHVEVLESLELLTESNMAVLFDTAVIPDGISPQAANHLSESSTSVSDEVFVFCGRNFHKSTVLAVIFCISSPIIFMLSVLSNFISTVCYSKIQMQPQPFASHRRACCLLILYNERIRHAAMVPKFLKPHMNICVCRLILPSRLIPILFESSSCHVFKEVNAIFDSFSTIQRWQLYATVLCHSDMFTLFLGQFSMVFFLQNAFSSEFIVGNWLLIPHSIKDGLPSEPRFDLFHNYREIVEWEYIVYTHFIFLIFFAIVLTCPNSIMFFVLVPTFVTTMAGVYSNELTAACLWPRIALPILYVLTFVANALTYRDLCKAFEDRAKDSTYVRDDFILEVSHEFLHLSDMSDAAMQLCCHNSSMQEYDRWQCMIWLLQKQRLEVQSLRHVAINAASMQLRDVSVMEHLESELNPNSKSCLASVCRLSRCQVELKLLLDENAQPTIFSREPELKHFLCSFMYFVLTNASNLIPDNKLGCLRISVNICTQENISAFLKHRAYHDAMRPPQADASDSNLFIQVIAELTGMQACDVSSLPGDSTWLASFGESHDGSAFLHDYCALEFVSRMRGFFYRSFNRHPLLKSNGPCCLQFSKRSGMQSHPHDSNPPVLNCLAAFALPCRMACQEKGQGPPKTSSAEIEVSNNSGHSPNELASTQVVVSTPAPLRILMVEDQEIIAKLFMVHLRERPLTTNYIVHRASNVEQALAMFRNCLQPMPGQTGVDGSIAAYDVVLLDNHMPLVDGGSIDPEAGVKAALLLREVEREKGLPKSVMVSLPYALNFTVLNHRLQIGITSGDEDDQELFVIKCQGNVWKCAGREQIQRWSDDWDNQVRAKISEV